LLAGTNVVIRTAADPESDTANQEVVHQIDLSMRIAMRTSGDRSESVASAARDCELLSLFSLLTLQSWWPESVEWQRVGVQRKAEIGIRLALGADRVRLSRCSRTALTHGAGASWLVCWRLSLWKRDAAFLYRTRPTDVVTLAFVRADSWCRDAGLLDARFGGGHGIE